MSPGKNNLLTGLYYYYKASLRRTPDSYRDQGSVRYSLLLTPDSQLLTPIAIGSPLTTYHSPFTTPSHEPLT
ncbi:MAG: hypothetical protein WDO19_05750 [Bacteroidota bacterium]